MPASDAASSAVAQTPGLTPAPLPDAAEYRRQRIGQDFYRQALVGPLFYVLGCVVATQSDARLRGNLILSLLFPLVMTLLVLLRWRNRPPQNSADELAFQRWYHQRWWLIFLGCACWSAFAVVVSAQVASNAAAALVVQLCTVAFGAASASAFAVDLRRNLVSINMLFLPQIALLVLVTRNQPVAITLAIFLCYLLMASRRYSRDYHAQIKLEYELLSSRAEIHRLSQVDELTGLYNRRRFNDVFQQCWHQAKRTNSVLTLVLVDLDHFKAINDRHGHPMGDHCLQRFGQELQQRFRRHSDHVMRIGGEEFAVVLPGTTAEECQRLAELMLAQLRQQPLSGATEAIVLQASFGIATLDSQRDQRIEDTFKRADDALYAAKQAGRAAVMIAT